MCVEAYCLDSGWLNRNDYTPSAPEAPQFSVVVRRDDAGNLQPLLLAEWKIKDDGECAWVLSTKINILCDVMASMR